MVTPGTVRAVWWMALACCFGMGCATAADAPGGDDASLQGLDALLSDGPGEPDAETDTTPSTDAVSPPDGPVQPVDAPLIPPDAPVTPPDAPVTPPDAPVTPRDAASPVPDAATSPDAFWFPDAPVSPDGAPSCDVPPAVSSCAESTTATGTMCAGTMVGNTCAGADNFDLGCVALPAPEIAFAFRQDEPCPTYLFDVTPGFAYSVTTDSEFGCFSLGCGVGFGFSGGCSDGYVIVVEKIDGGCGPFELTIQRF